MALSSEKDNNPQQAWQSLLGSGAHNRSCMRRLQVDVPLSAWVTAQRAPGESGWKPPGDRGMRTRLRVLPYGAEVCVGHSVLSVYLIVQEPPPPAGGPAGGVLGGAGLLVVGGG